MPPFQFKLIPIYICMDLSHDLGVLSHRWIWWYIELKMEFKGWDLFVISVDEVVEQFHCLMAWHTCSPKTLPQNRFAWAPSLPTKPIGLGEKKNFKFDFVSAFKWNFISEI